MFTKGGVTAWFCGAFEMYNRILAFNRWVEIMASSGTENENEIGWKSL